MSRVNIVLILRNMGVKPETRREIDSSQPACASVLAPLDSRVASENEGGPGLIASGVVTSAIASAKEPGIRDDSGTILNGTRVHDERSKNRGRKAPVVVATERGRGGPAGGRLATQSSGGLGGLPHGRAKAAREGDNDGMLGPGRIRN